MGEVVAASRIKGHDIEKSNCPIIIVGENPRIVRMVKQIYQPITLNEMLAKRLLAYATGIRNNYALREANELLSQDVTPILLERYEMLFTPYYDIDIMKFFCDIARKRKIAIEWCGTLEENTLIYGTEKHSDYKKCKVSDYDIICIEGRNEI